MRLKKTLALLGVTTLLALLAPAAGARTTVRITGGGWGHGIGMSQYGAYGRARNGASAAAILKHYYSGVSVSKVSIPDNIAVGLSQGRYAVDVSSVPFTATGGKISFKVAGGKAVIASGGPDATFKVEPSSTGGLRLFKNGTRVSHEGRRVFGDPAHPLIALYEQHGSLISISGKTYRYAYGTTRFETYKSSCTTGYCIRVVLSLPMQKYIYGLAEVPASWPASALKAQAISGRTYAYEKMRRFPEKRYPCNCHVYDSTVDQAYAGDGRRTSSGAYWDEWKAAVDATNGQVILYNGAPIQALYSSSSGGHTEHNENVWGGTPLPYLRGVPDKADATSANPNHTWSVEMGLRSFKAKLENFYNGDPDTRFGDYQGFNLVKPFGVSGRVTVVKPGIGGGVRITGSGGTARVSGWSIRDALDLRDTLFRVAFQHEVGARFQRRYSRLDGATGSPTSVPYSVPRGWKVPRGKAQNFEVGRLVWVKETDKVFWQHGPVLRKYDKLGREGSKLGMPASDIWGPAAFDGANYARGMIVWSEGTGSRTVRDTFRSAYRQTGGPTGSLGLPVGERQRRTTLPNGGKRQRFEKGTLYLNPELNKVLALWGEFDERYRRMDEATGSCGYPTTSVTETELGREVKFESGTMTWSVAQGLRVDC